MIFQLHPTFFSGSRALFIGLASTFFSKNNFKTGSYGTIHIFKNYFYYSYDILNINSYSIIYIFLFTMSCIYSLNLCLVYCKKKSLFGQNAFYMLITITPVIDSIGLRFLSYIYTGKEKKKRSLS